MSKRNVRARSGKQLYLNSVFNRGMLYTASEIPEGYSKIINNLDVTPSGDAISPRAPFMKTNHGIEGLSPYTYPIRFQSSPDKQYYINFSNIVTEEDYANDVLKPDYSQLLVKPSVNIYSRNSNALNSGYSLDENNNDGYDPEYELPILRINREVDRDKVVIEYGSDEFYEVPSITTTGPQSYQVLNSFTVKDADTITINSSEDNKISYRLANINAPESGYKWYDYGKKLLTSLLTQLKNIIPNQYYRLYEYGKDVYGRLIVEIAFPIYTETVDGYTLSKEISLSSIILAFGLAPLEYTNNESPFFNVELAMQEYAKERNLRIWNQNSVDPYYKGAGNSVVYANLKEDYKGDFSDLCLEVVAIQNETRTNYDTINYIDDVLMSYIDYMDGYAFIGRIIRDRQIYYKGVIYLTYDIVSNHSYFRINLPPNNLNGEFINIANATSNGYNLLNENPINTDNISDSSMPTSCLGIVAVDPNDNTRIITQSISGNTIRLRAIMNETYYTVNYPDLFSYKLHYTVNGHPVVANITGDPYYIESSYLKDVDSVTITIEQLEFIYKQYNEDKSHFIKFTENNTYTLVINTDGTFTETELNLPVLNIEGAINVKASNTLIVDQKLKDSVFKITFLDDLFDIIEVINEKSATLHAKWQYSPYGSEEFKDLTTFKEAYTLNGSVVVRSPNSPDTIDYKIMSDSSLTFKFILVPVYTVKIGKTTIKCYYQTQETYVVYPLFRVSTAVEYIDKTQLTQNINIKDATRVGVFNRQVFLYGPYLKTNTLFFSKFEEPWYFSFPYYAVNTEERIKFCYVWNGNLVLFGESAIWMLKTDGTVNESTLHKIYDNLTIADTDINLVSTTGNNLIFFSNNNGYIATASKYYSDPTNISVYRLTDNINNCLNNPKYVYRSLADIPLDQTLNDTMRCGYRIYVDNDYVVVISNLSINNDNLIIFYRYNLLYKYWTTYSIHHAAIRNITSSYVCEPNIGTQYVVVGLQTFDILYLDRSAELKKDFNSRDITITLDTGFLSIDPLNDKRFKDIILDLNNIQKGSVINVFMNFFIDGVPITLSDYNDTADFEYEEGSIVPSFNEGNYVFKYVLDVDASDPYQQPYGTYVEEDDYAIKVQGRNQLRIPVFGKGRLPSIVFKISTDKHYEIVGYSIIYKEKNVNIRR